MLSWITRVTTTLALLQQTNLAELKSLIAIKQKDLCHFTLNPETLFAFHSSKHKQEMIKFQAHFELKRCFLLIDSWLRHILKREGLLNKSITVYFYLVIVNWGERSNNDSGSIEVLAFYSRGLHDNCEGFVSIIWIHHASKRVKVTIRFNVYISLKSCSAQLYRLRLMPLDNLLGSKVPLNNRALVDAATQT